MKLKKILILLLLFFVLPVLTACDFNFNLDNIYSTDTTTTLVNYASEVNGTLTFEKTDYSSYPIYTSKTYNLDNIPAYNDVLLETQDYIRHANVEIISTLYEESQSFPFNDKSLREVGYSEGSGFVFLEDETYYYALTNYHVIDPEEYEAEYEVLGFGAAAFTECFIVASDPDLDLAVIKFSKAGQDEVNLIDIYERLYYQFSPGELVFAVGNPQEVYDIVTLGEFLSMQSISNVDYDVIYHNAQIDEGSSGGALVDVDGNFIGINTWGLDDENIVSFAIPNYIVYMFLINEGILE